MPALHLGILIWIATVGADASTPSGGPRAAEPASVVAQSVPMKIVRYAQRVVRQYDRDGDGRLQPAEYQAMAGQPTRADADHDGVITPDEFARYVADYAESHKLRPWPPAGPPATLASLFTPAEASEGPGGDSVAGKAEASTTRLEGADRSAKGPAPGESKAAAEKAVEEPPGGRGETKFYVPPKRLPPGLPDWFLRRDLDGDGQLTLAEFAPRPTAAQLAEFARMDANRDGLVTARECQRAMGKTPKRK